MESMLRKKYMGVWRWRSRRIIVTMITLPDRVRRYNVRKTIKKATLCCQSKLEKPSKRNSVTKVEFFFDIEAGVGFTEPGKGKKVMSHQIQNGTGKTKNLARSMSCPGWALDTSVIRTQLLLPCSDFLCVYPLLLNCRAGRGGPLDSGQRYK